MRYFFGLLMGIIVAAGCTPSEPLTEMEQAEFEEEEVSAAPAWFDERIYSEADSAAVYGYAMASATDSATAAELSAESALENLRFEIDRRAESIRSELAENNGNGEYSSPSFIIQLRNAVQAIDITGADMSFGHEETREGVHIVYTRAAISRNQVYSILVDQLSDRQFIDRLQVDF